MAEYAYGRVHTIDGGERKRLEPNGAVVENVEFQETEIIAALARKRMGLQSDVSRRLSRITEIFGTTRCTRKLLYYRTALLQTLGDMKKLAYEIESLDKNENLTWLEDERDRIYEAVYDIDNFVEGVSSTAVWCSDTMATGE